MAELKPCPFCGGKAIVTEMTASGGDYFRTKIECSICGVSLDWEQEFLTYKNKNVIGGVMSLVRIPINISPFEAWNRRVDNG